MSLTLPLEPFRENQAVLCIKVGVKSTSFALDALADLPQGVCPMGCMYLGKGGIDASAVQELIEQLFIGPFVAGLVAFGAFQVTSGFLEVMNIRGGRMFLLELK